MPLIPILITVIVVGMLLYLVNTLIPDERLKQILNVVVVIVLILWILQLFLGGGSPYGLRLGP